MADNSSHKLKLAGGVALGATALFLVSKALKKSVKDSVRREASSSFEYHLAVHCAEVSEGWHLVKLHKAADIKEQGEVTAATLGIDLTGFHLYPVERRTLDGPCIKLGASLADASGLENHLLALTPDRLQVVELVCAREMPRPADVPRGPAAFPICGIQLPFIGTTYKLFQGPYKLPTYNLAHNVFPPSEYPYGATVRSHSGQRQEIADFPTGTIFNDSAHYTVTMTADANIVKELIDRTADFPKLWNRGFQIPLQGFTANGLFTSSETSDDWKTAHTLLPRGFNQIKIKSFAPQIFAKTRAFVREWSNFKAGHKVEHVNDWLTAMTADAVVSCSMGMDMRNVERLGAKQEPHKFVETFRSGLGLSVGAISEKSEYGLKRFLPFFDAKGKLKAKFDTVKKEMERQVEDLVEATRQGEIGNQDSIIRSMLEDRTADGKHVRYGALYGHVVNLMIAGHETTAATLGFTLQLLAENPEYEARALEEVRQVLNGRAEPSVDDVPKLQFVEQCFREALRLYSPVTSLTRDVAYDTLLGGHRAFQGERIVVVTRALHTNPEYWGGEFGDPLRFNPDRFSPEAVQNRHPNAYHPWGFSTRACIGSQFALFEAKTFLASMLIHFRLQGIPGYKLVASTEAGGAAPSPDNLAFQVFPRPGGPLWSDKGLMQPLPAFSAPEVVKAAQPAEKSEMNGATRAKTGPVMKVLYGSNSGSSQDFASQVEAAAGRSGFQSSLHSMNQGVSEELLVPDGRLVIIVTSTYNGMPPDNAGKFKKWLQTQKPDSLQGLKYAVFGVGNSQWHTYQQFPREVDAALNSLGGTRLCDLGACDVDGASFTSDFEDWLSNLLQTIGAAESTDHDEGLTGIDEFVVATHADGVKIMKEPGIVLAAIKEGKEAAAKALGLTEPVDTHLKALEIVESPRELCQKPQDRSVRHVTLRLPTGSKYRAGDHLEMLPPNDPALISMTMEALNFDKDAVVCWDPAKRQKKFRNLVLEETVWAKMPAMYITVSVVMQWFPDLASTPDRKICGLLAERVTSAEAKEELQSLAKDAEKYKAKVSSLNLSLAELLYKFKGQFNCSLGEFVAIAKSLAIRRYSVSSSPSAPGADPNVVTITVGQVKFTTGTGRVHHGLASTCLGQLPVGGCIPGNVRTLQSDFHLPEDKSAPIIMVGPGTGLAPMMGFLQEREALLKKKEKLGEAILFFGCRARDADYLYEKELEAHLKSGALSTLHVAFSREAGQKVYVQDKIWEQRAEVWRVLSNPKSMVFICGDARAMAPDVKRSFQRVIESCGGRSTSTAANLLASMVEASRYLEDVWA
ncbi:Bifunctional cytochrome P450/NADPH--P450 reductase 2 (CYP102A3) (Fatty acid hydroxylase CypB) (Flavocytochrome P450 102A3) [Includes: Cytochrome P450 102A3 [Durusdinium trenchii]